MSDEALPEGADATMEALRAIAQLRSADPTSHEFHTRSPAAVIATLSDAEKIALHQRFTHGELSEAAATVLFGESLEAIDTEARAFSKAAALDRSGVFQDIDRE